MKLASLTFLLMTLAVFCSVHTMEAQDTALVSIRSQAENILLEQSPSPMKITATDAGYTPIRTSGSDGMFWTMNAAMVASTIFDIESTYSALEKCPECSETNPLMKPFINLGRPAAYGVQLGLNFGVMYLSERMRQNGHKLWWLPQVISITAHSVAGTMNLRF